MLDFRTELCVIQYYAYLSLYLIFLYGSLLRKLFRELTMDYIYLILLAIWIHDNQNTTLSHEVMFEFKDTVKNALKWKPQSFQPYDL